MIETDKNNTFPPDDNHTEVSLRLYAFPSTSTDDCQVCTKTHSLPLFLSLVHFVLFRLREALKNFELAVMRTHFLMKHLFRKKND